MFVYVLLHYVDFLLGWLCWMVALVVGFVGVCFVSLLVGLGCGCGLGFAFVC